MVNLVGMAYQWSQQSQFFNVPATNQTVFVASEDYIRVETITTDILHLALFGNSFWVVENVSLCIVWKCFVFEFEKVLLIWPCYV